MNRNRPLPSYTLPGTNGGDDKSLIFNVEQNDDFTVVNYHAHWPNGTPVRDMGGCMCIPAAPGQDSSLGGLMDYRTEKIKELMQLQR